MKFLRSKVVLTSVIISSFFYHTHAGGASLRRHDNVTSFYQELSTGCVKLGLKYNIPPAATLAIAGLESGYGSGYVSQVTGNVLSLGAKGDDIELPPLKLARNLRTNKLMFDNNEIDKLGRGNYKFEQRPASLKKDYRPKGIAGTSNDLAFLKYNSGARTRANMNCFKDFMKRWISSEAYSKAYRDARAYLERVVSEQGKDALFDESVNLKFIKMIGGKPNSFNYRKSWAPKVITIMNKTGLVDLCEKLKDGSMSFKEAWGHSVNIEKPKRYTRNTHANFSKKTISRTEPKHIRKRITRYDEMIKNIASYNSLPHELLISLIDYGSAFDHKNISRNNRYGLMQITVEQAQAWATANYYTISSVSQLLEPVLNVRIGAWVLAQARNHWNSYGSDSYTLALCEYQRTRKGMFQYIAYDKINKKLIIKDPHLISFVNSVKSGYAKIKQEK